MVPSRTRHSLLLGIVTLACAGLTGCVTVGPRGGREPAPETLAEFMTSMGRTRLQRAANGRYALVNSQNSGVNLTQALRDPRLVDVHGLPGGSVVALRGSRPGCPVAYLLVQIDRSRPFTSHYAGDCFSELGFLRSSDGVEVYQVGTADPLLWQITYGRVTGPIRRSQLTPRPPTPPPAPTALSAPTPPPEPPAPAPEPTPKPGAPSKPRIAVPPPVKAAGQEIVPPRVKTPNRPPSVPTIQLDGLPPAPRKPQPSPP